MEKHAMLHDGKRTSVRRQSLRTFKNIEETSQVSMDPTGLAVKILQPMMSTHVMHGHRWKNRLLLMTDEQSWFADRYVMPYVYPYPYPDGFAIFFYPDTSVRN